MKSDQQSNSIAWCQPITSIHVFVVCVHVCVCVCMCILASVFQTLGGQIPEDYKIKTVIRTPRQTLPLCMRYFARIEEMGRTFKKRIQKHKQINRLKI